MWHESFAIFLAIRKNEFPQKKKSINAKTRGGYLGYLLPLLFIRSQLSVRVKFLFSYNTLFLSSLGFMAA